MKIIYEPLDRVRGNIEYTRIDNSNREVKHYFEAIGTVVKVIDNDLIEVCFTAHDRNRENRVINTKLVLPVIDIYEYTMAQKKNEVNRLQQVVDKIKTAIEDTI